MAGRIVISNPQTRRKDCYAPAPKIDLTLRSNAEERVMVMDSLGQWAPAGFNAPTQIAVSTSASAGSFASNKYWGYRYVYVAKTRYPLVENAVTGNGSPAPRSNPSPSVITNSVSSTNARTLSLNTSGQTHISHIWIYRTLYFDTQAEAEANADGGNLFWIGEVANNSNVSKVNFTDSGAQEGLELIELDNFVAPQFQLCVYAEPYFWGFGNPYLDVDVNVEASGRVTITEPGAKWYNGRDGQQVTFDSITSGGFDNYGTFYIKILDQVTAQLYQDIALTTPMTTSITGTTRAHIKGASTQLYRSKPNNPFSWGYTDIIGEDQVAQPYAFPVGGGVGTAIAVLPNLNLLKLDTEAPNRTYILNLKNAGTPNFESSLRILADTYCISNHHSQFTATVGNRTTLWGIDSKSYSILESDGASQQPVSNEVFRTMRTLALAEEDREYFHGCYCPRLELNCMFVRTGNTYFSDLNKVLIQHGPTGYWSTMDVMDVLCSTIIYDRFSGKSKMFVGTSTGFLGEMFAEGQYHNWFKQGLDREFLFNPGYGTAVADPTPMQLSVLSIAPRFERTDFDHPDGPVNVPFEGLIGNWVTIIIKHTEEPWDRYQCRIATVANDGMTITFDKSLRWVNGELIIYDFPGVQLDDPPVAFYIGLIEMEIGKSFTARTPSDFKHIQQVWSTWRSYGDEAPSCEVYATFVPEGFHSQNERNMLPAPIGVGSADEPEGVFMLQGDLKVDLVRTFGIMFRDRSYTGSQLVNYEIRISPTDGDFN